MRGVSTLCCLLIAVIYFDPARWPSPKCRGLGSTCKLLVTLGEQIRVVVHVQVKLGLQKTIFAGTTHNLLILLLRCLLLTCSTRQGKHGYGLLPRCVTNINFNDSRQPSNFLLVPSNLLD